MSGVKKIPRVISVSEAKKSYTIKKWRGNAVQRY